MLRVLVVLLVALVPTSASVAESECEVRIATGSFDPSAHDLTFLPDSTTLVEIDGHSISGSDGDIPKREIRMVELRLGDQRFQLPHEALRDLLEPSPHVFACDAGCSLRCDPLSPVVAVRGGDGAASYTAVFVFSPRGAYVDRILSEHPTPESPSLQRFRLSAQ